MRLWRLILGSFGWEEMKELLERERMHLSQSMAAGHVYFLQALGSGWGKDTWYASEAGPLAPQHLLCLLE